eukprot:IDg20570t1
MWNADLAQWRRALLWYPTSIKLYEESSKTKSELAMLDNMIWDELGVTIAEREPSFIEADEYRRVIQWKLKRGKWRPRLQKFSDELSPDLIKTTASAILAACDKSIPFMSDELLVSVPCFKGQRDYSLSTYMTLIEEVQLKCEELGNDWSARDVEQAIFAASVAHKLELTEALDSISEQTSGKKDEAELKPASEPEKQKRRGFWRYLRNLNQNLSLDH